MLPNRPYTALTYFTLIAFGVLALLGVILVTAGPESTQRLGLLFGILGTGMAALGAGIRADQSAKQTNGMLDDRIEAGVHRAMTRRAAGDKPTGDPPPPAA